MEIYVNSVLNTKVEKQQFQKYTINRMHECEKKLVMTRKKI